MVKFTTAGVFDSEKLTREQRLVAAMSDSDPPHQR